MEISPHIIEKVIVDVKIAEVEAANSIKDGLDIFLKNELFPELDKLFDKYDTPEKIIRFQKLFLDLRVEDWKNYKRLSMEILSEIEKQLQSQLSPCKKIDVFGIDNIPEIKKGQLENLTIIKNAEQIFVFFLKNGFLPWYGNENHIQFFAKKVMWKISFEKSGFILKLKNLFQGDYNIFLRFVYQFPIEMVVMFLVKINNRLSGADEPMNRVLNQLSPEMKMEFLRIIFSVSVEAKNDQIILIFERWLSLLRLNEKFLRNNHLLADVGQLSLLAVPESLVGDESFQEILNQSLFLVSKNAFSEENENVIAFSIRKRMTEILYVKREELERGVESDFFPDGVREIAVANAGLLLLHPYLNRFFSILKITNNRGEILPSKSALAVQILHFLATGSLKFFEGNLVFEKFLCGIPLNMPIPKKSCLTSEVKKEADILLREVIKSWPALKNTSPDGLRKMFLQRNGKLIQHNKNFKMVIERKAQDILLEQLKWNISIIKLKWLTEMLFVDW